MIDSSIMSGLGNALIKAGAPLLRDLVVNSVGGSDTVQGRIAGVAIDALADNLGVPKTADPQRRVEGIVQRIETSPETSAPIVRQVESQFVRTMDMGSGSLEKYVELLHHDSAQEGILQRLWRPLFAVTFTFCYAVVILTICWLMWTRQWGQLSELAEITGFLTFAFIAGTAVLGVQVWKRTEEKQSGIT